MQIQEDYGVDRKSGFIDTRLDPRRDATATLFIKLANGAEIAAANNLANVTTYVMAEQENWFEPELEFWIRALEPGALVFDIGANHGIYSLSLAPVVGEGGRIIAVEPGTAALGLLRRSIEHSGRVNITTLGVALADRAGSAHLYGDGADGAIMNEGLTLKPGKGRILEPVEISTLDTEWRRLGCPAVDFVKLDVEGMELEVLSGGASMIGETMPMIMFEISGERTTAEVLGDWLKGKAYDLYRYLPGLGVLVPFRIGELSRYQINLVAMTRARAKSLARRNLLVLDDDAEHVVRNEIRTLVEIPAEGWPASVKALPVWKRCGKTDDTPKSRLDIIRHGNRPNPFREALWLAAAAIDESNPPVVRYVAMREACRMTAALMHEDADYRKNPARLWTTARLASMCGMRELALEALGHAGRLLNRPPTVFEEPFLPALSRFDLIDPGEDLIEWAALMTIEPLVTLNNHSSRFTTGEALPALERWQCSRFLSAELERRRQLLRIRVGLQAGLFANPAFGRKPLNIHLLQPEDVEPASQEDSLPMVG